jgi:hypothetical protein
MWIHGEYKTETLWLVTRLPDRVAFDRCGPNDGKGTGNNGPTFGV